MSAPEKAFYDSELSPSALEHNASPAPSKAKGGAAAARRPLREEYRAVFDGARGEEKVVLRWSNEQRTSLSAVLPSSGTEALPAAYASGRDDRIVVTPPTNTAGGAPVTLQWVSERLLARVEGGAPLVLALRQHKLGGEAGKVVDAALLAVRDVLGAYDEARLAFLAGYTEAAPLSFGTVKEVSDAYWPAARSVIDDLGKVAEALSGDEADTVRRVAVAARETFERMTKWAGLAHGTWKDAFKAAEASALAEAAPEGAKKLVAGAEELAQALKSGDPLSSPAAVEKEKKAAAAAAHRLGLSDSLERHLADAASDVKHRRMALETLEETKLRSALGSSTDPMFEKIHSALESERAELRRRYGGDPNYAFFLTREEEALAHVESVLPKLHQEVNNMIWTRVVESRLFKEVVGDVNGLVVWAEDDVTHWSRDVSHWVHDSVHLSRSSAAAVRQTHAEKQHLGERPIAQSSHEAAQARAAGSLVERGEKLFAAGARAASSAGGAAGEEHVVLGSQSGGAWTVDRQYKILPTVSMARGVLTELAYTDHVHLRHGPSDTDHDFGLSVAVSNPFVKEAASVEATARWLSSKGPFHVGGAAHVQVAGIRQSGTHARHVDITGFAGYDDGATKTGVFYVLEQEFVQDPTTGAVVRAQPVTTVHPFFSHQLFDNGRAAVSAEFKRTPTLDFERTYKASYTHVFRDDLHVQGSFLRTRTRDPLTGGPLASHSGVQLSLLREFGAPSTASGLRSHIRLWAGYNADADNTAAAGAATSPSQQQGFHGRIKLVLKL